MASGSNAPPPIIRNENGVTVIYCPHPDCNKSFAKHANYMSHSHTGETPYHCEICGQQFRWQSSQKAHMKSHERRRQRQATDEPQVAPPQISHPVPVPHTPPHVPRGSFHDPHPTLPAIRPHPPYSGPRVEAMEPPVFPQPQSRRDVQLVPLYSGSSSRSPPPPLPGHRRPGVDAHPPLSPHVPPIPRRSGQGPEPPGTSKAHDSQSGGSSGSSSGGDDRNGRSGSRKKSRHQHQSGH